MAKTINASGPAAEIATMGRISQQAAAWALGLTPRSLRDHPEIKRSADGSYDVRDLVDFARSSGRLPSLTDEHFEQCLQIAANIDVESIAMVKRAVDSLVREVGGDEALALAAIGRVVWADLMTHIAIYPESFEFGPKRFDMVYVCENPRCDKYRIGRRWLRGEPPEGPQIGHYCGECMNNLGMGMGRTRTVVDPVDDEVDVDSEATPRRKARR